MTSEEAERCSILSCCASAAAPARKKEASQRSARKFTTHEVARISPFVSHRVQAEDIQLVGRFVAASWIFALKVLTNEESEMKAERGQEMFSWNTKVVFNYLIPLVYITLHHT